MINRILIIAILLFMSCDEEVVSSESVYGCTDEAACNFDSNATIYVPNSCDYEVDECGVCGGNNSSCDDFFSILLIDEVGNVLGSEGVAGNHTDCMSDRSTTELIEVDFSVYSYPNPFNSSTSIEVQVPEAQYIELKVIDANYNDIRVLNDGGLAAGQYAFTWDGLDSDGNEAPLGYYRFIFTFINFGDDGEIGIHDSSCYLNIKKDGMAEDSMVTGYVYDSDGNAVSNASIYLTYDLDLNDNRPSTSIDLALATSEVVNLWIENMCGELVRNIAEEFYEAGMYSFQWDANNNEGLLVLDGAYQVKFELGSGQNLSTTIFLKRHLDDYYEECYDAEGCETIATTDEQGYFEFSQSCLGFDSSFTQTDAEGNELGIVSVPRRLKLFADTGEAYGSTDFFVVPPQSGAEININIDNE
tara:strand:+ start:179 stop:1423 length:1245 start_codon:yes stop_codon:yes gene_type:complete